MNDDDRELLRRINRKLDWLLMLAFGFVVGSIIKHLS